MPSLDGNKTIVVGNKANNGAISVRCARTHARTRTRAHARTHAKIERVSVQIAGPLFVWLLLGMATALLLRYVEDNNGIHLSIHACHTTLCNATTRPAMPHATPRQACMHVGHVCTIGTIKLACAFAMLEHTSHDSDLVCWQ